jgi:hypothetical protein
MERIETQSLAWRIFAILVALTLALAEFVSSEPPRFELTFASAKMLYWLLAPAGLLGYAYGFRFFGQTFWKFYAVIFTIDIVWRMLRTVSAGGHSVFLVVPVFAAIGLTCLALLRYGNLLNRRQDMLANVFS